MGRSSVQELSVKKSKKSGGGVKVPVKGDRKLTRWERFLVARAVASAPVVLREESLIKKGRHRR